MREAHGGKSQRQSFAYQSKITRADANPTPKFNEITSMDIRFSNLCNLACRMCGPDTSSKIAMEYEDLGLIPKEKKIIPIRKASTEELDLETAFRNINHVYFAGGEPLIMEEHHKWITWLADNNPDVDVRYSTNGTTLKYKQTDFIDVWKKMRKVTVAVSVDGIGDKFDYVRYGNSYDNVISNLKRLYENEWLDLNIRITVSIFNVGNLRECMETLRAMFPRLWIQINILVDPDFYSAGIVPDEIRAKLIAELEETGDKVYQPTINMLKMSSFDQEKWEKFCHITKILDAKRNQSFVDLYPEFKPWYK